ncbi:hypothetical protein BBP40_011660 [Aspergillus hancockii]|nr:hypothetical protein BBP40_011660 [Aspergillus hancockii]
MSSTMSVTASSQIRLSPNNLGIIRGSNPPPESLELANRLLQRNHDELHIFFRDMNGHNHLVHNLLTRLALGATPAQIQTAFDDDLPTQRPMPPVDFDVVKQLADETYFYERIGQIAHYTNFLVFFEQQIEKRSWPEVVNEYVFSRSRIAEALLPLMYDGAYHSLIHLGLGAEFEQPSIIAEALAQAAAHASFDTDAFFLGAEKQALGFESQDPNKPLLELLSDIAASDPIRRAAHTEGLIGTMKQKRAIFPGPAGDALRAIAAQFRVTPANLARRTAEMTNICAYLAGAAQRGDYAHKIDFFFMHCVTSSIFLTALAKQPWLSEENKARLVEWKGRLDLAWYATCGVPDLDIGGVVGYSGGDGDWGELFAVVNEQHDDGHVAKFVRALKNGAEMCGPFEGAAGFPVTGDLWLKIAWMAYDTTLGLPGPAKWVVMAGMDGAWAQVPKRE